MSSSATQVPPTAPARPQQGPAPAPSSAPAFGATIDPVRLLKRYKLHLAISVVVGVVLGVIAVFPLVMFTPRYTAQVIFEAKPPIEDASQTGIGTTGGGGSAGVQELNLFMQTLVADMLGDALRAQLAVHPTVRNQTEFAKSFERGGSFDLVAANDTIKSRLRARVVPDTSYIMLGFTAGNKSDAATIANTAADIFQTRVNARSNERVEDTLQSITARRRSVQIERRNKEQQMQRLLGDNRMESLDMRLTEAATTVQSLSVQIAELRNREIYVDRLKTYEETRASPEGIVYPDEIRVQVQGHPHIAGYNQQLAAMRANLRSMRERFGPNHYQVRQVESAMRGVEVERDAEEQRLLSEFFNNAIEMTRMMIASIDASLRESESNRAAALLRMQEVTRTQAEFESMKADAERLAGMEVELSSQLDNVQALMQRQSVASRIQLVQRATAPDRPSFPKLIIVVPVVTFLVVSIVAGLILLREILEQRVRMPADVQMIPRARLLGVIADVGEDPSRPASVDSAVRDRPEGVIAEQVRQIRTAIAKARPSQQGGYALLITGAMPGSGASSVIAALATSCAAMGDGGLGIEANLGKPRLQQFFNLADAPGLSDARRATRPSKAQPKRRGRRLPRPDARGPHHAFERLNSDRMSALLAEAARSMTSSFSMRPRWSSRATRSFCRQGRRIGSRQRPLPGDSRAHRARHGAVARRRCEAPRRRRERCSRPPAATTAQLPNRAPVQRGVVDEGMTDRITRFGSPADTHGGRGV